MYRWEVGQNRKSIFPSSRGLYYCTRVARKDRAFSRTSHPYYKRAKVLHVHSLLVATRKYFFFWILLSRVNTCTPTL